MEKNLELRMYGLVPYNMSPIQQGIQFGHAVVDYAQAIKGFGKLEDHYNDWANNWKTFIILNGGTTNTNPERLGTLNQHFKTLTDSGVMCQPFYEPDLGDQLTAVVFIVDERVFNKELYPDFESEIKPDKFVPWHDYNSLIERDNIKRESWVESIGGEKNVFLRDFLKNFRLA